jgi:hypothetical protein
MELRYCEKCGDIIPLQGKDAGLEPVGHFLCPRCEAGGGPERPAADQKLPENLLEQSSLNLFSPNTVVIKRQEQQEKEARLKLAEEELWDGPLEGHETGSANPARTARKLQFRCLHCRAVLMVRPVQKASRMVCPKCRGNLFIDQSGVVSKRPPIGSDRVKIGSSRIQAGSAQVKSGPPAVKPASAQVKTGSAPVKPASAQVKTGPAPVKPASAQVKTTPAQAKPASAQVKTTPAQAKPASAQVKTTPAQAKPASAQVKTGSGQVRTGTLPAKPGSGNVKIGSARYSAQPAAAPPGGAAPAARPPVPAQTLPQGAPAVLGAALPSSRPAPGSSRVVKVGSARLKPASSSPPAPAAAPPSGGGWGGWSGFGADREPAPAPKSRQPKEATTSLITTKMGVEDDEIHQVEDFFTSPFTSREVPRAAPVRTAAEPPARPSPRWRSAALALFGALLAAVLASAPLFVTGSFLVVRTAYSNALETGFKPPLRPERVGEVVARGLDRVAAFVDLQRKKRS